MQAVSDKTLVGQRTGQEQKFSDRVEARKLRDAETLSSASRSVYRSLITDRVEGQRGAAQGAVKCAGELLRICDFFGTARPDFPDELTEPEAIMQFAMSETGIMRRKVVLTGKWWKDGAAPMLCGDVDGEFYALLPASDGGYTVWLDGAAVKVTKERAGLFSNVCYCFYRPFENRALTMKDFALFLCGSFRAADVAWLLAVSLLAGLLGMIMPMINQFIFHNVIPSGTSQEILGISVLIVGTVLLQAFCGLARSMWVMRIGNKMELLAQNAVWARLMSLPVDFFRDYSSGELSQRAASINQICSILGGQLIPTLLASVFSFVYLFQISTVSPVLLLPSLVVVLLTLLINLGSAAVQIRQTAHNNKIESQLSGMVFQLLDGLTKIKVAGAEARAFGKWAEIYGKLKIVPDKVVLFSGAISNFVSFGGTIVLYYAAYQAGMSVSEYIAFNTAFSLFVSAVMSMAGITSQIGSLKPALEMLRPILEETPETAGYKKQVSSLSGEIEVNQVKFRYNDNMPNVLDGLELHIKPGEYIGIVGSSGCGKSTLMRVLLGFEKPQSGSVYYDMQDMNGLDLRSVRRRIGVVLQNGKLFSGDIYSNIVICAPWLSVDEAWAAAERSGFAEDIRKMPMKMFTMISEGGGGLSGGQQQRLLIARALASNPDIVMFDEATSALDNITQALVVKTLEEMKCTRLVIAHRLSTIKGCSRIIYLHKGKVVESGTYEELMAMNGRFAEMAKRQMV